MGVNKFEGVGRLVAVRRANSGWLYIMYAENTPITLWASYPLASDIKILDYIKVTGYVNGQTRKNDDGTTRHTQGYVMTSINRTASVLYEEFGINGTVANTYFNVYLRGQIENVVAEGRYDIKINAAPELHDQTPRLVRVNIKNARFPELVAFPGQEVCVFAKSYSIEKIQKSQRRTYQYLNVIDYAVMN